MMLMNIPCCPVAATQSPSYDVYVAPDGQVTEYGAGHYRTYDADAALVRYKAQHEPRSVRVLGIQVQR